MEDYLRSLGYSEAQIESIYGMSDRIKELKRSLPIYPTTKVDMQNNLLYEEGVAQAKRLLLDFVKEE